MKIDWNRPLVTNAGKPAKRRPGAWGEHNERSTQLVDIPSSDDCFYFFVDGSSYGDAGHLTLRNATPAEILAAPDVWPDWQDWALNMTRNEPPISQQPQSAGDWLTPETAIGARLPCGAVVTWADWDDDGDIKVYFDRRVAAPEPYHFRPNGKDYHRMLPDLIPPTPQPAIDRAAIVAAVVSVSEAVAHESAEQIGHRIADKLGCPPDAPKVAPWEAAYEAWIEPWRLADDVASRDAWKAAVEWCVGKIDETGASLPLQDARTRIMGDDA